MGKELALWQNEKSWEKVESTSLPNFSKIQNIYIPSSFRKTHSYKYKCTPTLERIEYDIGFPLNLYFYTAHL